MLVLFSHFGYNEINIHTYILNKFILATDTELADKTSASDRRATYSTLFPSILSFVCKEYKNMFKYGDSYSKSDISYLPDDQSGAGPTVPRKYLFIDWHVLHAKW